MNLPTAFATVMRHLLKDEAPAFFDALDATAPASVRYHPVKGRSGGGRPWQDLWDEPVPWADEAWYLTRRPAFTFDPCLHAGCYYVQEASSMFVAQAIRRALQSLAPNDEPLTVLDLCAAPGGKSTLVSSMLPDGSLLVANEVLGQRARILQENLIKWGNPSVMVTQNEAATIGKLGALFDLMLVDAPCSGEGLFRKDFQAVEAWSPEAVRQCALRQMNILREALTALKPGGFLIYSTCTYNTDEDEAVVAWLVKEAGFTPVAIDLHPEWGVTGSLGDVHSAVPVYRFLPHKTRGEGFFLCLLQKPLEGMSGASPLSGTSDVEKPVKARKAHQKGKTTPGTVPDAAKRVLLHPEAYRWSVSPQGVIRAFPAHQSALMTALEGRLRVLHAGVPVGEVKGGHLLPHPALALSTALNRAAFPVCSLDLKQAVDYLKREALRLAPEIPTGWVLVTYEDHALGWVKNIGNRANNNWPAEWRIRSENPFT